MQKFDIVETRVNNRLVEPKCCYESVRIRKGTLIIGIYQLISIPLSITLTILVTRLTNRYTTEEYWNLSFSAILLITVLLLLAGLYKENYRYLIPYLFIQVCSLLLLFIIFNFRPQISWFSLFGSCSDVLDYWLYYMLTIIWSGKKLHTLAMVRVILFYFLYVNFLLYFSRNNQYYRFDYRSYIMCYRYLVVDCHLQMLQILETTWTS